MRMNKQTDSTDKRIRELEAQVAQIQRALIYSNGSSHQTYMVELQNSQLARRGITK